MKPLTADGNLFVALFNGYGDAFLALPALREIRRKFHANKIYLACFEQQEKCLFPDLDFQFIHGNPTNNHIVLKTELGNLDFAQAVSFNAYSPSEIDQELMKRFCHIPKWGFCDAKGRPLGSLSKTHLHMRDQYFQVIGWNPSYSLEDRQAFIPPKNSKRTLKFYRDWVQVHGEFFYTLHIDSLPEKMWPIDNWIGLVSYIWSRWRAWPLILGEQCNDVIQLEASFNFAHKLPSNTGIASHFAAVNISKIFIGIDSIFAHVADSYQKPMITLFGESDPIVWGSIGPNSFMIQPDCGRGMNQISLDKVICTTDSLFSYVNVEYN